MAFDSDVEAYLNQLSRKTYSLKQDVQTLGYSSSRRTSTTDKPSEKELNSSDESGSPIRTDNLSSHTQRKEVGSVSDITALSEKYRSVTYKKPHSYDKLSSLEQKYLKKHQPVKDVTESDSSDECDNSKSFLQQRACVKLNDKTNSNRNTSNSTIKQKKIDFNHVSASRKTQLLSDSSSVDEELAQYLKETSLTDDHNDGYQEDSAVTKTQSVIEDSDTSMDGVINLGNILTVDDILGQITDDENKAVNKNDIIRCDSDRSCSSRTSSQKENLQTGLRNAFPVHNNNSNLKNKTAISRSVGPQDKSCNSFSSGILLGPQQEVPHNANKEGTLLLNSRMSSFYSSHQQQNEDHSKPQGVLLAQTSNNVFHSSRRKSLVEYNTEGTVKASPSKSSKKNTSKKVKPKLYSEESVVESIASSIDSNLAVSVIEEANSVIAIVDESVEEDLVKEAFENHAESPSKGTSENSPDTEESTSLKASSQSSQTTKKSVQDKHSRVKSLSEHSTRRRKRLSSRYERDSQKLSSIPDQEESIRERRSYRESKKTRKYPRKQSKSKRKHRSSTLESSSSETLSDSEVDRHRRHYSSSYRHKWNPGVNPWFGPPYMPPWPPHYHQHAYSTPAGIFAHYPSPTVVEGLFGVGGVGVKELMQQQVALTRQFLDSQRALYHAYTATLTSSHHYTSLHSTEKYIKKRKPPLTFSEAYKLVQEEMNTSE